MKTHETAVLAAGCFWGVEDLLRNLPGVTSTRVGYCGGSAEQAAYKFVKTGVTGHAETVKIEFDPAKLSYSDLLAVFFRLHDPTQLNRQMNDVGTQYRSAIFYQSEDQRIAAEAKIREVNESHKWPKPIATVIVPAEPFYDAEEAHQDYLVKNPGGYTCHWMRD
ncbi:MAG: peptide-methionine (S)-S-oxide reductase MsrA [Cryobacterium sp.]|nr:peptide-methionine (S)-S-oxide reductase MsrA [Oligoflexia bacterium]